MTCGFHHDTTLLIPEGDPQEKEPKVANDSNSLGPLAFDVKQKKRKPIILFEGIDFCGKTTLIDLLLRKFSKPDGWSFIGKDIIAISEPKLETKKMVTRGFDNSSRASNENQKLFMHKSSLFGDRAIYDRNPPTALLEKFRDIQTSLSEAIRDFYTGQVFVDFNSTFQSELFSYHLAFLTT